ncbi:MAG: hypothetical protein ABSE76_03630 [Minisyncoccia bacterium]|jgi:hypothetical protein
MNKILLSGVVGVLIFFALPNQTLAVSGMCSDHGGVNCSIGPASDGNAICNDGFESSVSYSDTDECNSNSKINCPWPTVYGCTKQSDYDLEESTCQQAQASASSYCGQETEAYASMGIQSAPPCNTSTPAACTQADLCQAQINEYQAEVKQSTQCVANAMAAQEQQFQLQAQEQNLQLKLQQQTDELKEQLGNQEILQAAQIACQTIAGTNGTASIENNKCVISCNSGYQEDVNDFCEPISVAPTPTPPPAISTPTVPVAPKILPIKQVVKNSIDHASQAAPVVTYTNATSSNTAVATSTPKVEIKRNFLDSIYHLVTSFFGLF